MFSKLSDYLTDENNHLKLILRCAIKIPLASRIILLITQEEEQPSSFYLDKKPPMMPNRG